MSDPVEFDDAIPAFAYQTPRELEGLLEPPDRWFSALTTEEGEPIRYIALSREFCTLGDGSVIHLMDQWGQNSMLAAEIDPEAASEEDRKNYERQAEEAARKVEQITGFSPKEIDSKKKELEGKYVGNPTSILDIRYFSKD